MRPVLHYVINTMETASLSRAACPPHSLHNVIFITDERKIIQGRSLTVGARKLSVACIMEKMLVPMLVIVLQGFKHAMYFAH